MKIRVANTISETAEQMADRAADLRPVAGDLELELVRENQEINFDPLHKDSILHWDGKRGVLGSKRRSYGELLRLPKAAIVRVLARRVRGAD